MPHIIIIVLVMVFVKTLMSSQFLVTQYVIVQMESHQYCWPAPWPARPWQRGTPGAVRPAAPPGPRPAPPQTPPAPLWGTWAGGLGWSPGWTPWWPSLCSSWRRGERWSVGITSMTNKIATREKHMKLAGVHRMPVFYFCDSIKSSQLRDKSDEDKRVWMKATFDKSDTLIGIEEPD